MATTRMGWREFRSKKPGSSVMLREPDELGQMVDYTNFKMGERYPIEKKYFCGFVIKDGTGNTHKIFYQYFASDMI